MKGSSLPRGTCREICSAVGGFLRRNVRKRLPERLVPHQSNNLQGITESQLPPSSSFWLDRSDCSKTRLLEGADHLPDSGKGEFSPGLAFLLCSFCFPPSTASLSTHQFFRLPSSDSLSHPSEGAEGAAAGAEIRDRLTRNRVIVIRPFWNTEFLGFFSF